MSHAPERPIQKLALAELINHLLLCWSVFYAKLPDGQYDGMGELRNAMGVLKELAEAASVPPSPPQKITDSTIPHHPMECGSRYCAQHRDLWRYYEDNIAVPVKSKKENHAAPISKFRRS